MNNAYYLAINQAANNTAY